MVLRRGLELQHDVQRRRILQVEGLLHVTGLHPPCWAAFVRHHKLLVAA